MDLRLPVGALFLLLGAILALYGFFSNDRPAVDLGWNVNAIWGLALAAFGLAMWLAARRRDWRRRG
jgi:hypothetical protein